MHRVKSQLIAVKGNMTVVRYRNEIPCPVVDPLVQQRQLIFQQDNAWPHVARVCRGFLANLQDWPQYSPDLSPHRAFVGRSGEKGKEAPEPPSQN